MRYRLSARNERGQATFSLILVLVVVAIAAVLLQRTAWTAESINNKAATIAQTGRGINTATDAVLQLDKTNMLAGSILETAKPLQGKLDQIIHLAQSIDGLASSINGTAGAINNTAHGINGQATRIVDTANSILRGVQTINRNLDTTIGLANAIKGDTGDILGQAVSAKRNAACIDARVKGAAGTNGDCR